MIALVARWVAMTLLKLQAEEELRRNQERFRDFAEAASDWLWEMDEGLRFSYFSHDFHEKAGVAPARLLGKTREELLAASDPIGGDRNVQPDWDAHLADLKAHRPFRNFVHPRAQADGSVRYTAINGRPIFDQAGSFKGYRGSARDVTERIVAEQDLRTSQVSLANAQRLARLGNWDWNIVTNELSWSDEIYRIFGLTPRQFGATFEAFLDRVHPNDRVNIQKVVDDALAGAPYSIDHRIVHPDGLVRIVHEQGEVDFDAGGKPVFMRGTVQDVTEQRQALAALAEREQRIRAITDNVGDALITIDTQGIIDSVNPAAERIFGYRAEEMLGRNVSMLM
ncbi:MAG TPA: PAS domain S-box protein, partial [Sphingomonadaceae bacterium]|nr:PAS domain S-box protein [Sphingomonadaceae bacterium]